MRRHLCIGSNWGLRAHKQGAHSPNAENNYMAVVDGLTTARVVTGRRSLRLAYATRKPRAASMSQRVYRLLGALTQRRGDARLR